MRFETMNPIGVDGSSDPRDLYDNAGIADLLINGPLGEYLSRLGVPLKSWRGIMQQVTDYLIARGYESNYLAYGAGVVVERQTQLVQRSGELYRVANVDNLPLTLTGTWATDSPKLLAVGDAALRQLLLSDEGAKYVTVKKQGTNTVARSIYSKFQKEIELDDYVSGGTDDTVQFKNMLADIPNKTTSRLISIPGLTASYSGTTPRVITRAGDYKISETLKPPAYLRWEGEMAFITQTNSALDLISAEAYQWEIEGLVLIGGRHQLDFYNSNSNSAMIDLRHIEHFLAGAFAINSRAIGVNAATGQAWSHLSMEASIYKSRIMACRQSINNACDSMTVKNSWIQPSKKNMAPSTAVIINKGVSATDPDCLTRLKIQDTFLIPDVGEEGKDRVNNVRWVDNYGSFETDHARFGGENGGMSILWQQGGPNMAYPWNVTEAIFKNSTLFCGPDSRADSCVVGIQGQIPMTTAFHNCIGPVSKPLIANLSSTDIPAYMAAFEAASGRKAYEYFKLDISGVTHDLNASTSLRPIIPNGMYPYILKGRRTRLRKQAQTLTNAFAANIISFSEVTDDNLGAFSLASPTRLIMPNGCSKMTISVSAFIEKDGAAKTISVDIIDSGNNLVDGVTELRGNNPDTDRIKANFEVEGPPGTYWSLRIRHNAASTLNLADCKVRLIPSDHAA